MHKTHRSPTLPFLLLAAVMLTIGLACKMLIPDSNNNDSVTVPAESSPQPANTPRQSTDKTQNSGELRGPGDFDLPEPAAGLDELDSYTQNFISTTEASLHGQPYSATTTIQSTLADRQTLSVLESENSGSAPIYRAALRTDEALYVQQEPSQACRASQDTERADPIPNPALRLPPVFGAEEIGRETRDGLAAIQYRFDERAVRYAAGQNGTASGELWVTEDSGLLLDYRLTVETTSDETPAVQTWEYSLSQVNTANAVGLPAGCLALPLDLPVLPGAQNLTLRPGFARYTSPDSLETAAQYYRDELSAAGWQVLPTDETADGTLALSFTIPQAEGAIPQAEGDPLQASGTRLAVVRLEEISSGIQVIIQTIQIKTSLQVDLQNPELTLEDGSESDVPEAPQTPSQDLPTGLPDDLPIYPGASDVIDTEFLIMFSTPDAPVKVSAFYQQELEALSWNLDENNEIAGMITQTWSKEESSLFLMILKSDKLTQVMISSGE